MNPLVNPLLRSELAPSGVLRAGINRGNPILVQQDPVSGKFKGVAVDLALALADRIGVPLVLLDYDGAGRMLDAQRAALWDIAFLAVDPARAQEVSFTSPYVRIEGAYLVPAGSRIEATADVDAEGVRVSVGAKSAYDLFLTRALKRAELVRAPTFDEAIELFLSRGLEVAAGVRQPIAAAARRIAGSRVLEEPFMSIGQAAAVPKGRQAAAQYVREFVEDAKASGLVARSLEQSGMTDVAVAPLESGAA